MNLQCGQPQCVRVIFSFNLPLFSSCKIEEDRTILAERSPERSLPQVMAFAYHRSSEGLILAIFLLVARRQEGPRKVRRAEFEDPQLVLLLLGSDIILFWSHCNWMTRINIVFLDVGLLCFLFCGSFGTGARVILPTRFLVTVSPSLARIFPTRPP